ncbi:type II secretion system protein [Candidatus Uhrbacteria bacterium]|jgi:type II secretory pathway pseudopilin PulG|nr:type II secretion system protein [Candidatus Uhrbacteria bacterium]
MRQDGFTLVETLLYILLMGIVLVGISGFVLNLFEIRAKTQAASEVAFNARLIQDRLTDSMRHAEGVNTGASTFAADPGVLSINMVAGADDPHVYSLTADDGQFQISEAGGGAVSITTDDVSVSNLVFTNLTSADDVAVVQVQFTIETVNDSDVSFFDYAESFQTTLRVPLD